MSDNVYLNRERTAVVEATDPGKKWQIKRKDAQRLGLLPDGEAKPQARRAPADTTRQITTTTVPDDTERTFTTTQSPQTRAAKK